MQRNLKLKLNEWVSVTDFGAVGTGIPGDLEKVQNAVTAVSDAGGGTVFVPRGNYNLAGGTGLSVPGNVRIIGEGRNSTTLQAWHTDQTVITVTGSRPGLQDISIFGKGTNSDPGVFGATENALNISSVEGVFRDILVKGGNFSLFETGVDNYFENVNAAETYSSANVATNGADWYVRCKFDHDPTGIPVTQLPPFPAWAGTTVYVVGNVVVTGGFSIQCSVAGTSAISAPTLKNYGVPMIDASVVWLLLAPESYIGMNITGACGENHILQTDFSGSGYTNSVEFFPSGGSSVGPPVTVLADCVLSQGVTISAEPATMATWFNMHDCQIGNGDIAINPSYNGATTIIGNFAHTSTVDILVGAGVENFKIDNNIMGGGAITVDPGASDHYTITNKVWVVFFNLLF